MKLSFQKNQLIAAVNIVLKAVPSKTTLSILECILIEARNGQITLTANDMELAIETKVIGMILEEGQIAIDAKLFSEIIRKLPENDLILETKENSQVVIRAEKAVFTIPYLNGEDFVFLPQFEKSEPVMISQFSLKESIRQTIFSVAAAEASSRMMSGEHLVVEGNSFSLTALDGHRISIRKIGLSEEYEAKEAIVPGKTLAEISRILSGDVDKQVSVYFSRNHISFEFEDTIVVSRLIDGVYFNTAHMISGDYVTSLTVNRKDFLDAIERSVLLVRESDKKPIVFRITDGQMNLSLTSSLGNMNEELPIEKQGPDLAIAFNPRFFIDALRAVEEENVDLYLVNAKAPCILRDAASTYVYLILPVNFVDLEA